MFRFLSFRLIVALGVFFLIPGCGVVCNVFGVFCTNGGAETGSPELKRFESEQELAEYLAQQIQTRNDGLHDIRVLAVEAAAEDGGDTAAPPGAVNVSGDQAAGDSGTSDRDYSQTTIQEEGVDEADVVKTDGRYLYVIENDYAVEHGGAVLRIVDVVPAAEMAEMNPVPLEGWGREIYLHDGKVVALTETFGNFIIWGGPGIAVDTVGGAEPGVAADEVVEPDAPVTDESIAPTEPGSIEDVGYERPRTIVTIVDVSDPQNAVVLSETQFEGVLSSSRMIDGLLHLVISNFQDYYYDILPALGTAELDVRALDVSKVLPDFTHVDAVAGTETSRDVVTWEDLYRPTDPDGFGLVTVISLDVDNDADFTAVGIVAQPGLIYSSLNALYLTDTRYDFTGGTRESTDIYKFAYVDRGVQAVATGSVPGRVLNQYSMGEHNYPEVGQDRHHLRVATTVGPTFTAFGQRSGPFNNVYVLGQTGGSLTVVGSVEDIEPGETIQSARFIGNRGYLVTFERIDPLITLDLSNPAEPRVAGILEVPGFSTFIVPMDEDHLLTVGQYIPEPGAWWRWGVQLTIFDVSNFSEPAVAAVPGPNPVILGEGTGASSDALYNPKAFTYFAQRGLVALPVSISDEGPFIGVVDVDATGTGGGTDGQTVDSSDGAEPAPDEPVDSGDVWVPQGFEGVVIYQVSVDGGFTELGRINTRFEDAGLFWSSFMRGVFIGDDVFAVTDNGVRGAPINDLQNIAYQLLFK